LLLLSAEVTLAHRPKDTDMIKKVAESANKSYKEESGRECKLSFDASLPDDSAGGVIGSTLNGKIKVDNTLEERLRILREKVNF
jgi:V-type H+-transporting ATPase subunit E